LPVPLTQNRGEESYGARSLVALDGASCWAEIIVTNDSSTNNAAMSHVVHGWLAVIVRMRIAAAGFVHGRFVPFACF